jgi:hypothetical protein
MCARVMQEIRSPEGDISRGQSEVLMPQSVWQFGHFLPEAAVRVHSATRRF